MTSRNNFKGYTLSFDPKAKKELGKIDSVHVKKIIKKLNELIEGKLNVDVIALQGNHNPPKFRLKCGDYRVVFVVQDLQVLILVIAVGHRREIYNRF